MGKRARVRERRYTGPEEIVQPGLLHEHSEATDADGMTAEETVAEITTDAQLGGEAVEGAAGQEHADSSEAVPEAEPETTPDVSASAADESDSSSDAGDAEEGVPAGDQPA